MRPLEVILIAGSIALFVAVSAKDGPMGDSWSVGRGHDSRHANFAIERRDGSGHSRMSFDVPWDRLKGLSPDSLNRSGSVKFEYVGDAGSLLCEGKTQLARRASGNFTFQPNPAFAAELQKLGYTGTASDADLLSLAVNGVTRELAAALPVPGIPPSYLDLEKVAANGIDARYIREIRDAGYPKLDAEDFVKARIHGVTPDYLAAIKAAGYDLPMERMVELRIHGISVEYLNELKSQGLKPNARELVDLRNHGVAVELLKAMADSGYPVTEARDAIELSTHGVSPAFLRDVKELGYKLSPADLVQFRIHGVDGPYLRKLADSGYSNLTPEKIVKLRIHGVD